MDNATIKDYTTMQSPSENSWEDSLYAYTVKALSSIDKHTTAYLDNNPDFPYREYYTMLAGNEGDPIPALELGAQNQKSGTLVIIGLIYFGESHEQDKISKDQYENVPVLFIPSFDENTDDKFKSFLVSALDKLSGTKDV